MKANQSIRHTHKHRVQWRPRIYDGQNQGRTYPPPTCKELKCGPKSMWTTQTFNLTGEEKSKWCYFIIELTACILVRGTPSRMNPDSPLQYPSSSLFDNRAKMISSGTSFLSFTAFAIWIVGKERTTSACYANWNRTNSSRRKFANKFRKMEKKKQKQKNFNIPPNLSSWCAYT